MSTQANLKLRELEAGDDDKGLYQSAHRVS